MLAEFQPLGIHQLIQVPPDLSQRLNKMESIVRFVDPRYPEGVFVDNDKLHTQRLVAVASQEIIKGVNRSQLIRELWVHDIPELITGDIVSPTKEQMENSGDTKFIDEEDQAAQKILSPEDLALYRDFVSSGNFLKSKTDNLSVVTPEGLVAYIIDKIDGNMYFHFYLAKWFAKDDGQPKDPSEASLVYCFNQANKFKEALAKAEEKYPEAVATCRYLLDYQLKFISDAWSVVDPSHRPDLINQEFEQLEKSVTK